MREAHLQKTLVATATLLLVAGHALGQLVLYEPSWGTFPEDQEWERLPGCTSQRWLENGWLAQHVEFGGCVPGQGGDRDGYRFNYAYLAGAPTFFIEWTSWTDGPSSEIVGVAPSAIVASTYLGPIDNHFTIAADKVRYIRDVDDLPHVYVDITPAIPHRYRLEYYNNDLWYIWTIDEIVVDEGTPEGPFPWPDPIVYGTTVFRAFSWEASSTTRWRYIRAGEIPVAGSLDFTNDGFIDHLDYYLFRDYLSGPDAPHARGWSAGDVDEDADIDLADFAALQNHFTGDE